MDAIFIVRQIIEKAIEYNHPAFLCFADLTKAFDRIKKQDILNILRDEDIPVKIIRTIDDIYTHTTTKVKAIDGLTDDIPINEGVRQGDSLSPFLFNLVIDRIIKTIKPKPGYRMGTHNINIICYADDAILIAENEDDLQRLAHQFNTTAKQYNMQISPQKTKCMVISKEPIRCKLQIEHTIIEQVMSFKYLGVQTASCRDLSGEIQAQNTKALQIAGCLRDTVWRNKYMRTEGKLRIYKAMVRPILTYATETRAETKRAKQKMRVTEMKVLRSITNVTLRDKQTNKSIRERCNNIQDVVKWSKTRKKKWKEHVERMGGDRLARICMNERPRGKRPPGRPPVRWAQSWFSSSTE